MLDRKLILLVFLVGSCWAQDDMTKANSLLMKSNANTLILITAPAPLHVSGRFKVYKLEHGDDTVAVEGDFLDLRHFRTKYEMTGFQQIMVRNEGQSAQRQNTDFEPIRVRQVRQFMMPSTPYFEPADVIKKISNKDLNGIPAQCVEFKTIKGQQPEYPTQEICFAQNPDVTVFRSDGRFETAWSNFEPFHGKYYPKHVVVKDKGEKIVDGDLTISDAPQLTAALFAPPAGFEIRKACTLRVPPVLIKGDQPTMPSTMPGGLGVTENVVAELKLGADGRVQKWTLIEVAEPALNLAVQRVVPTWQFEPAKCDGQPMPAELDYQINFRR